MLLKASEAFNGSHSAFLCYVRAAPASLRFEAVATDLLFSGVNSDFNRGHLTLILCWRKTTSRACVWWPTHFVLCHLEILDFVIYCDVWYAVFKPT